ncbi:DUF421 domain-containing protein [Sphingobacterium faecium NBRC 15299]|uniref:DUF421 domain-containing protein n=1 Tax=Sphingobacterium faecium TaxID=34087 RepID=UPI000D331875|nr:YetF domain-containing protein [Sphingobacterium faecium]PTX09639.1 uncharacterized membrane protein YcaP (DUF421 family) [Sphingobacterium faecium]GEM63746.1 DUF421 domain-containing protein [Sphingobacterium faecium NBRC 15299]
MIEIKKMFLEGAELDFLLEIVGRSVIMFILILVILRLSGKKGVRQLTLFEVAIILSLGSAAGDPMFQEELPIIYALVVLFSVIVIYKFVTWLSSKSTLINKILEGEAMVVVRDGMFDLKHEHDGDFSKMEFFSELRNQSVEHLGQVRMAVLEIDGSMSILFYPDAEVKYGLPLFPDDYKRIISNQDGVPVACMYCGQISPHIPINQSCPRCQRENWAFAIDTKRV